MEQIYSPGEYSANDPVAKKMAFRFLLSHGFHEDPSEDWSEKFKRYDFSVLKDNQKVFIEVEHRGERSWGDSGRWAGFITVSVPKRKDKSQAHLYITFNHPYDTLGIASMKKILSSPIVEKYTINKDDGGFFDAPLEIFKFFTGTKDKPEDWKWVDWTGQPGTYWNPKSKESLDLEALFTKS